MAFLDIFLPYLQLPPTIYTIILYRSGHLEISWEVFAKKSAEILSFRISFIIISITSLKLKLYNLIDFPTLSIGQPKASEHHSFTLIFTCHYKRIVCGWFSSRKLKSRRKRLANTLEHENELSDPLHLCTFTYPKVIRYKISPYVQPDA